MDETGAVRMLQPLAYIFGDAKDLVDRYRCLLQALGESFPFQIFHNEEAGSALLTDVIEVANVRMAKSRDGSRLAIKALLGLGTRAEVFG